MRDVHPGFESEVRAVLKSLPRYIDDVDRLITNNRIFIDRTRGIQPIPAAEAIDWGWTGPCLRACGVPYDIRKAHPYYDYDQFDWQVPVGTTGDVYDRYLVRMEEMRQSVKIARQALDRLAQTRGGEYLAEDRRYVLPPKDRVHTSMEELIFQFKIVTDLRLPAGEAYHAIESSKGELGFYVVSDGTSRPVRCHIRGPGLMNVQVIPLLAEGRLLSDMVALIGSLDFVMGEVDR